MVGEDSSEEEKAGEIGPEVRPASEQGQENLSQKDLSMPVLSWQDQDDQLRVLWRENKTPDEISEQLGRSIAAIMTRAARLGLPRRAAPGRKRGYKRTDTPRRARNMSSSVRARAPRTSVAQGVAAEEEKDLNVTARVCLMCLKKFQSQGRHNRICPSCKGSAEYSSGSSTPDFVFQVSK
ncbi:MAG TPA: hypothetical protein DD400_06170 [Rhodospirillaceae bacterium]|nr:hypothetical protein [Rhodospirillaceae bacterium]